MDQLKLQQYKILTVKTYHIAEQVIRAVALNFVLMNKKKKKVPLVVMLLVDLFIYKV